MLAEASPLLLFEAILYSYRVIFHGLILVFFLNISLSLDSGYHVLYLYVRDAGYDPRAASVRLMGPQSRDVYFLKSTHP